MQKIAETQHPRELLEAIGDLASAIHPHFLDTDRREKTRRALVVLIDHILALPASRAILQGE